MFSLISILKYSIFSRSKQAIYISDQDDKLVFCNRIYKKLAKKTSIFEFLGQSPEDEKKLYYLKKEALEGQTSMAWLREFQVEVRRRNNLLVWRLTPTTQREHPLDINNLPLAMAEFSSDGELKTSNELFYKLFEENQGKFTTFIKNLDVGTFSAELELKGQFVKIFSKYISKKQIILAAVEITQQKALEEKIDHNQKLQAIGQLAGGIAHDFNNILSAIIMSCDFLLASHRSSDPLHPDLLIIKQNAVRAANLVQQLLAFSRRQTLQVEICNIADLVSETRSLLERMMGTNIKFKMHYTHDLWKVKLDKNAFQRVLVNLIINAKDAIGQAEGNIDIKVKNVSANELGQYDFSALDMKNYVLIEVSDTGPGMEESIKDKIFEPFFTTKEVGKGTGLGLSMSYGIVKQQGGFIKCNSTLGQGTSFLIFLPEAKETQILESSDREVQKSSDLSGDATILLVDDEDIVRKSFARALKSKGYEVIEATNGAEALKIYNEQKAIIDIIISDVIMPVMDGPSFYAELEKMQAQVKFVFISGYTKDAFAEKYNLERKKYHFIAKPVSIKDLALKIKEIQNES